nr:MAG TPA: hypothetical protein [Caudoviricetes sp.]
MDCTIDCKGGCVFVKKSEGVSIETDETVKPKEKNVKKVEKVDKVIYVGPSIPGIVTCHTVFSNGVSKKLDAFVSENPMVSNLIVPISKLVDARKQLSDQESAISICYTKIKEQIKRGE